MWTPLKNIFLLTGLLWIITPSFTQADWNKNTQDWFQEISQKPVRFSDSFVSSTWGAVRAYIKGLGNQVHYSNVEQVYRSDYFETGRIGVLEYVQKNYKQVREVKKVKQVPVGIKKAKLMVFLPGIFNDAMTSTTARGLDQFVRRGYHVLVVANPYSETYLAARPRHLPGVIESDALIVLDLIQTFIKRIGAQSVLGVEIYGESFGAFLASVALALDSKDLVSQATLVSPPLRMSVAMDSLDRSLNESEAIYFDKCKKPKFLPMFLIDFVFAAVEAALNYDTQECAEAIVSWANFHEGLVRGAELIAQHQRVGRVPQKKADPKAYEDWKRAFRFERFAKEFLGDGNPKIDPVGRGDLTHWLEKITLRAGSPKSFRIITAVDDFLNDPQDWHTRGPVRFSEQNLLILPWGGHLGFIAISEYKKLLDLSFPKQ